MNKYTITGYSSSSETFYTFGPFAERAVQPFLNKMAAEGKWQNRVVTLMEPPDLLGTGLFRSDTQYVDS